MAANRIVDEVKRFVDFSVTGFKYNLQVFPDTITAGSLLFALLFQSPPLATLGAGFILLNFIHPKIAEFTTKVVSNTVGADADPLMCSSSFPGVSYDRLLNMSSERTFGSLNREGWPSFYSVVLGYIGAWIGMMPLLYQEEIKGSPKRRGAMILGSIVFIGILILGITFRMSNKCETLFGSAVGILAGLFVGGIFVYATAMLSERKMTNVLGFPLIQGKAKDGKPIYVCERKE
jgi:hypothetical protein